MRQSFKAKLVASLFVPALVLAAGASYATGTNKTYGDQSAANPTTPPAASSNSMNNSARSGTSSADATFARLDTNHDGKLSASEAKADPKVERMWKTLDPSNHGSVTKAEFEAHASDLK
jgi:hypothetical protein